MQTKLLHEDADVRRDPAHRRRGHALPAGVRGARTSWRFSDHGHRRLSGGKRAFFDWGTKAYQPIPVEEQVEVASMVGDVAIGPNGKPSVHVHAVLGRRDGTALAGHLQEARVRPTLEIIATESPAHLCKVKDAESGLALISVRV
jgi:predicted DNA-binding protein with PD1-like motif